jgi:hypothetical protein
MAESSRQGGETVKTLLFLGLLVGAAVVFMQNRQDLTRYLNIRDM